MIVERRDAVVVGSGLAGLTTALALAPLDTLVLTKTDTSFSGSTPWAQGGIAVPRDAEDAPIHLNDTLVSGAGHTDRDAAAFLVDHGAAARDWLETQGVRFDRESDGSYVYGREGAHSSRRVLHVGADGTGAGLAKALTQKAAQAPHLTVRPRSFAVRLLQGGLLTFEADRGLVLIVSPRIVLAGGGLGQLFDATTAPVEATGDTIALAHEAGAELRDLEMVQFHPTALALRPQGAPNLSLLTEALRGDGALLVTADSPSGQGLRPLDTGHTLGSLGPRDVLSRAIFHRQAARYPVWLDARPVADSARRFPTVTRLCAAVGLDPTRDLLPVVPAVHYTMGGVATDLAGQTTVPGVWAVGETARTGVHGANRLASNSLLECVVFGRSAAASALAHPGPEGDEARLTAVAEGLGSLRLPPAPRAQLHALAVQALVSRAAGPVRSAEGLEAGLDDLALRQDLWDREAGGGPRLASMTYPEARQALEARNRLILAPLVLTHSLNRKASLGAHFRSDSPEVTHEPTRP